MILKKHWHIIIVIVSVFNTTFFVAQNTQQSNDVFKHLTKEQRAMLAEQQMLIDEAKINFKNNLTLEQKKLLLDKGLPRGERTKLLKKSLTKKQRSLIEVNNNLLRDKRIKFKRSLTKKQVIRLRRFVNHRDVHDRKRLVRRLRRLISDNINSDN